MAYFMIEIILISQHGFEIFELNQKNLRGAAAKKGRNCANLGRIVRFTVCKPSGKRLIRRREVPAPSADAPLRQADKVELRTETHRHCAFCSAGRA
jgi:hypothetical protein